MPVVIHNVSNYDFHLIIKEIAEEFRKEIHCIPEDKEKYKSFSILIMYKECKDYTILYSLRLWWDHMIIMLIIYQNCMLVTALIRVINKSK